ncbi:hypothetical protein [Nitratireductor sp. GZWM139]|uniref:hypothetical protein n=1 Tax=Nitratireductor sp. GZWM139 TaxID=2950541 RepID=UPI0024BEC151|nr:hypothetical protein [Nitratireductor sp. GZWM139]MDJ1464937.1 hypothetical protein [Nitratireductor sp. GZWM139]
MLARTPWVKPVKAQKPKPHRLNRDRRRYLVETVVAILKQGEASKFQFEATCRHAIRSRLCLNGWSWHEAEAIAKDIVDTALNRIGAYRPSWAEGQPEWSQNGAGALIERTRCIRCRSPLEEQQTKFCSKLCATSHFKAQERLQQAEESATYDLVVNPGNRRAFV